MTVVSVIFQVGSFDLKVQTEFYKINKQHSKESRNTCNNECNVVVRKKGKDSDRTVVFKMMSKKWTT